MRWLTWIALALLPAYALTPAFPAKAQSLAEGRAWIHAHGRDCCPHETCFPVEADPGISHWIVWGYHSEVRIGKERPWPFAQTWGCAYPHDPGRIRCLFVKPQEQTFDLWSNLRRMASGHSPPKSRSD